MKKISITENFIYMLMYRVIVTVTPLILTPYVVRVLSPVDLGNYNFAESVDTYFAVVAVLGCTACGQREIAICRDDRAKYSIVFWDIILLRLCVCTAVIIVYLACIKLLFSPDLQMLYLILAVGIVGGILDITWLYQGLENFSSVFWRNLITRLSSVLLIFLLVRDQNDFYKYVIINVVSLFVGNITLWGRIHEIVDFVPLKQLHPTRWLLTSFAMFLPTVASTIYHQLDATMIGAISGDPMQNAYYGQSLKISTICTTTVATVSNVVAPRLAYTVAKGSRSETNYFLGKALEIIFLIGLPMTIGIMAIADVLIPWFLGDIYIPSIPLLRCHSVLCLISGVNGLFGSNYLIASKRHNRYSVIVLLGCLINLTVNSILIPAYAAQGAAVASVFSECAILALILVGIVKELNFKGIWPELMKITFSGLAMGVLTYWLSGQITGGTKSVIFLIVCGVFLYGMLLLLLKERMVVSCLKKGKDWITHYGFKR